MEALAEVPSIKNETVSVHTRATPIGTAVMRTHRKAKGRSIGFLPSKGSSGRSSAMQRQHRRRCCCHCSPPSVAAFVAVWCWCYWCCCCSCSCYCLPFCLSALSFVLRVSCFCFCFCFCFFFFRMLPWCLVETAKLSSRPAFSRPLVLAYFYYYFPCRPTMRRMIFNIDHS